MGKDSRTYIKVHDGIVDHPKIDPLSDKSFRFLFVLWCWCSRHTTDGFVPKSVWMKRGSAKLRAELIESGMVEEFDDGSVLMHDYLDHQRSKYEIESHRDTSRTNGKLGGRPRKKTQPKPSQVSDGLSNENPAGNPAETQDITKTKPLSVSVSDTAPTVLPEPPASGLSITQRSKRITDAYATAEPMCKWPAVNGVVMKAIKAEKWADAEINDALQRLAKEGRGVTVESLRTELSGFPSGGYQQQTDGLFDRAMQRARQREVAR